jgi:bilin biosynthesis protein
MRSSVWGRGLLVLAVAGCAGAPEPRPDITARLGVLEPALAHPDATRRRATIEALGAVGPDAVALLLQGLDAERDSAVRHAYVRALAGAGGEAAIAALQRLAVAPAEADGVRLAAVGGLTKLGGPATDALMEAAKGSDAVARAARLGLSLTGGDRALQFFRNALDRLRLDRRDRRDVASGLARLATADDADRLRALTGDEDPAVRRTAVIALGRLGLPDDGARLERLRQADPDASVRRAAGIAAYRVAR